MISSAKFSADGVYRHWLKRDELLPGSTEKSRAVFVMLNPSTADHTKNDPTLTRCINFAVFWGYNNLTVVNLFDWIATNPKELPREKLIASSPYNDPTILSAAHGASLVVCAWGAYPHLEGRGQKVLDDLKEMGRTPRALALTKGGQPRHPLYLPADLKPSILL